MLMLSYPGNGLWKVVRPRPLMFVAVTGDPYSIGYSVSPDPAIGRTARTKHQIRSDPYAYRPSAASMLTC
jgi:hypothetical protein